MDHHLAVGAELAGDAAGQLGQVLQRGQFRHENHSFPPYSVPLWISFSYFIMKLEICKKKEAAAELFPDAGKNPCALAVIVIN